MEKVKLFVTENKTMVGIGAALVVGLLVWNYCPCMKKFRGK